MSDRPHTDQLRKSLPAKKFRQKRADTMLGGALGIGGAVLAAASFVLVLRFLATDRALDVPAVVVLCSFFGGGMLLIAIGANIMSRELTSAALRDIGNFITKVGRKS
jgi:drug/metabolite transporter (DMT)-like permease